MKKKQPKPQTPKKKTYFKGKKGRTNGRLENPDDAAQPQQGRRQDGFQALGLPGGSLSGRNYP